MSSSTPSSPEVDFDAGFGKPPGVQVRCPVDAHRGHVAAGKRQGGCLT
jgi:hypothetical protein